VKSEASSCPGAKIGPIAEVIVVAADLDEAVARYVEGFGYGVLGGVERFGARANDWRAPRLAEARTVLLGPTGPSGAAGRVRLVECRESVVAPPLRTYGWTSLELCVLDVHAAVERAVAAGWQLLRAPARLGAGKLPLLAGQLAGPSGEGVYLTQFLDEVPGFDLPVTRSEVDGVFIAVLGVADLVATRALLEERYAVRRASDRNIPVGVLNKVFGLPEQTLHRLSTLQLRGQSCIEIDQLPTVATPRPCLPGRLPSGIAGVLVETPVGTGFELLELPGGARLGLRGASE
jgi:hypothetical protein